MFRDLERCGAVEARDVGSLQQLGKRPANPEASLPLEKYTGLYANKVYGKIEVRQERDKLELFLGSQKSGLPLVHWDHDAFELIWPELDAEEKILISFEIGEEGEASSLKFSFLTPGINVFERL